MADLRMTIHRYVAVVAVLIALIMTVLDVTVVNVALPVLAEKFNVSDSYTVWIVTIYQLVITMLLLPISSLGDLYSYKRNFLIGVIVFTVGSALCAASQSFAMIIGARAIQGIGAACVMSVTVALIRIIYPREMLGRGLALNAMVVAISTAAGPTLAGALLSIGSWHWLFLINVPIGFVAFFIGKKYLPKNPGRKNHSKFDLTSALANMLVFGLIFYSLGNMAHESGLGINLIMLVAGIAVGVFYVRHQLNHREPLLPVDLLKNRLYSLSILTSVSSFIGQNIAMIALPFLFLNNYGFSEITTGLLMTPWPLATMIVSPFAARLVEKHSPGVTAAVGMVVFAIGLLMLIVTPQANASEWDIVWRMAICGVGFGLFQTPNNIVMVSATPIARSGAAGGMQSTARLTGQTLGATIVTVVFALAAGGSVRVCLMVAIAFAIIAGVFSISRIKAGSSNASAPAPES